MKSIENKIIISFFIFILIFFITHFTYFPGSLPYFEAAANHQSLLDLKPEFSLDGVYQRLESFGEPGRQAYLKLIPTIDIIFPLSAFLFLLMLGGLAAEKYRHPLFQSYYWVMSVVYLVADFLENSLIVTLLLQYPQQLYYPASLLGYISLVKRVFMMLSLLVPLFIILLARFRAYKMRRASDRLPSGVADRK